MNEQPVVEKEAIHDGITEISQVKDVAIEMEISYGMYSIISRLYFLMNIYDISWITMTTRSKKECLW